MNRQIGFSTGVFYPHTSIPDSLRILREYGVSAVEIGPNYSNPRTSDKNELTAVDLSSFAYVSHHAPAIAYGKNSETRSVFDRIRQLMDIADLKRVVFHPDTIEEISVFHDLPFKVAFENMDNNKKAFKTAIEMEQLLAQDPLWQMVCDVNHIYTNDPSLASTQEFIDRCGGRIKEVHLSGFKILHDPLYKTHQLEIIAAAARFSRQIIVESQLSLDELSKEYEYVSALVPV